MEKDKEAVKQELSDFVRGLQRYNLSLNKDIEGIWKAARGGDRTEFYKGLLRIARTGQKVGEVESIVNEG